MVQCVRDNCVINLFAVGEPAEHHDAAAQDLQPCGPHPGGGAEPLQYRGLLKYKLFN